ncbi:hypothetical protein BSL78_25595 [Apostichopus japonicus]|uniref:LRAT domain-containing protein n=1 Tax=Stichopus japonicus TaxID=307972 RepID=A0A2G8JPE6_STIJA|nr:hypothetical protein BSL78_25595 [Apostichopus japonicus]
MAANSPDGAELKQQHDKRGCHGNIQKYEDDNDGNAKGYFCSHCKEEWLADKENMNGETVVKYQHEAHHIVPYFCCMQNSDTGNYIQWKNKNKTTGGLKPGDQVAWLRPGYWHHAIVEEVKGDSIKVIEWSFDVQSCGGIHSKIKTQKCGNCCRPMYKVYYPEEVEELNPPEVVLMRARARLGDTGFCPCYDNCEHFATYCKTGLHHCNQLHQWKMTLRAWIYGIVVSLLHVTVFVAFSEFIEWKFTGNNKHWLGAILLVVFEIFYYIVVVCGIYCCDSPSEGFRTDGDKEMSRACRCASLKAFLQSVLFVSFAIAANVALLEALNEKYGPWSEAKIAGAEIGLGIAGGMVGNIVGFFILAFIPYPCCRNEIPVSGEEASMGGDPGGEGGYIPP